MPKITEKNASPPKKTPKNDPIITKNKNFFVQKKPKENALSFQKSPKIDQKSTKNHRSGAQSIPSNKKFAVNK